MTNTVSEFIVYTRLKYYLNARGWRILCGSPPGGTNSSFRKCVLPKEDLAKTTKGSRDEVDLIADRDKVILLLECKPRLSESLSRLNILSETDYEKLKRILCTFTPSQLAAVLEQALGLSIPAESSVAPVLAVGIIDCSIPSDVTVIELGSETHKVFAIEPLLGLLG